MSNLARPCSTPVLIIIMGVSGCGKSTLGRHLSEQVGLLFLEADDFHSAENKAWMSRGRPLTDAMREPWIASMCDSLRQHRDQRQSCVLAYSGLRKAHRRRFRELGYPTLFLHLSGPKELARERVNSRAHHFMPAGLIDDQYDALESTVAEADVINIDISQSISQIQRQSVSLVDQFIATFRR